MTFFNFWQFNFVFLEMIQAEQALLLQIDELKAKFRVERLQYRKEIGRLEAERNKAIKRAEKAEAQVKVFEKEQKVSPKNLQKGSRNSYKTLSALTDRQHFNTRAKDIQNQLGPAYKIAKIDDSVGFSKLDFLAFQRIFRLPLTTVAALSKIPNSVWPTVWQLRSFEQKFIDECGGFVQEEFNGVEMIWAADPCKVFIRYVKNLRDAVWGGDVPNPLTVVLSGDKGSETTKFGLFVPSEVPNAQSPSNFLLLSMYKGSETRVLIEKATAVFFGFVNSIIENGGLEMNFGAGSEFIAIKVLFVADLKMLPLIFGVDHSSSTTFCPFCLVKRNDHKEEACSGRVRQLSDSSLLNIPLSNIVCPPLHILQGLTNKILEVSDKEKRKELFGISKVKVSYRETSLLTGRDGQKFLKFVVKNPEIDVEYRTTLTKLYELSQLASVEKFKVLAHDKKSIFNQIASTITAFSESWRSDNLPAINKLHLVEAHLADFIKFHSGWGIFGEQAIESLHHLGNVAENCCFGNNKDKALKFHMKVHLVLAISAPKSFRLLSDGNRQSGVDSSESGNSENEFYVEESEFVV
jgi:hypothetical protein